MKKRIAWSLVKELGTCSILKPKLGLYKAIAGKDLEKVIQLIELANALVKGQTKEADQ